MSNLTKQQTDFVNALDGLPIPGVHIMQKHQINGVEITLYRKGDQPEFEHRLFIEWKTPEGHTCSMVAQCTHVEYRNEL